MRRNFILLTTLLENLKGNEENEKLITKVRRLMSSCHKNLKSLHAMYNEDQYPFEHAGGKVSISRYAIGLVPVDEYSSEIIYKTQDALDKFYTLYYRLLGRLAFIAESVETTIGLSVFPDPPQLDITNH